MVFADLVGSTELGASQDPERTTDLLDRFYDATAGEIDTAGGTVEKFAGDAVLAVFGVPAALEDHAERALHAALAMQRRVPELFGDTLALRIGVNTEEVIMGRPREGSSFVTGDPVNVAARLEQTAEPGKILAGERTVVTARGAFEFDRSQRIEAKGKPEGVDCRRQLRGLSLMRPRGVSGLQRAFVGRDEELAVLESASGHTVEQQSAGLVTIVGDAGVGKTRLVREFWELLGETSPEALRRTGHCLSYGRGITYWPLAGVLKEHFGIVESDPPETVLDRLGAREILALTLGLDVAHGLHPLSARDRFQDAWVGFIEELASQGPVVMLVEDIHWAETQLLDLLDRLVRDVRGPLLLVATARPELFEQQPGWGARVQGSVLALDALPAEEVGRMLDDLLGGAFPGLLREVVVERSEGNPFFVEELLATMSDRGLLRRENGAWEMAEMLPDFAVPDTVAAVVAARVDLLEPAEKSALQAASVIGRIFWAGPVYELVHGVEPDLRVLEERDFIRRRSGSSLPGDREYAIKHALTREVAYAGLPREQRARLHAAFARCLERTVDGADEYAPLLAHHYAEAVRPEDADLASSGREHELSELRSQAQVWLRRAAELAVSRFEIDDGLALLHRALDLDSDESERVALWRAIGRANVLKLDGEAFWTAMQRSLEGSDPATVADTYSELGFQTATRAAMWKRRPDVELISDWIERALELSEPESPARAKALIARATVDPEASADAAREASQLADRLDDLELRSWAWDARCRTALSNGDYEEAFPWVQRQIEIASQLSDPDHVSLMYLFSFLPTIATCRFEEARGFARAHDEVAATLSPHHRLHSVWLRIDVERVSGCWDAVAELTARAEQAVAANIATPRVGNAQFLLACALGSAIHGDEPESRRLEHAADDLGMEGYGQLLDPFRVELALARGDLAEVERELTEWRPLDLRDVDLLVARLNALVALGRRAEIEEEAPALIRPQTYAEPFALRAPGWAHEDAAMVRRAIDRFEALGLDWHAAKTTRLAVDGKLGA